MLEGIGRVGAYVQQRNLKTAAKYRIKTGQSLIPNKTEKLQSALQKISSNQSTKHSDPIKTATIKTKLKGGRKLSADEMSYLRENDPDLYRKAKGAQRAREELEKDLSSCHTKAEARQALMRAQLKASGEALAELTAAKGGGAGVVGGASSFAGGMGDDISADINADGADIIAGTDINDTPNVVGENSMSPAMASAVPIEASATNGMVNSGISGEAAEGTEDVAQAKAPDNQVSEKVTKEILSSVMREINTIMSELNKADDVDKVGEQSPEDNGSDESVSMEQTASAKTNAKDAASEIIEKLLYKLRAIQNAWDEFTHSKEYKAMPEGQLAGEDKHTGKSAIPKGFTDDGIIDMMKQYTSSFDDGLSIDSSSVDISR